MTYHRAVTTARLAPLVADYIRDADGAHDVLRDALLERGVEPLPRAGEIVDRLDGVLARLSAIAQVRVASASVRRLVPEVGTGLRVQITTALDAVEADPAAVDGPRNDLFRTWTGARGAADRRVVWAAWMLLRGSPATALRTARAVRAAEIDAQIAFVADAFALA